MLSLEQIAEIATDASRTSNPRAQVVGVTPVGHDSGYAEVVLTVTDGAAEPCRLVIEVEREVTADVLRRKVGDTLNQHGLAHPKNLQV